MAKASGTRKIALPVGQTLISPGAGGLSVGAAPNTYLAYRYGVKELMRIGQGMGSGFQSVMQKVPARFDKPAFSESIIPL